MGFPSASLGKRHPGKPPFRCDAQASGLQRVALLLDEVCRDYNCVNSAQVARGVERRPQQIRPGAEPFPWLDGEVVDQRGEPPGSYTGGGLASVTMMNPVILPESSLTRTMASASETKLARNGRCCRSASSAARQKTGSYSAYAVLALPRKIHHRINVRCDGWPDLRAGHRLLPIDQVRGYPCLHV